MSATYPTHITGLDYPVVVWRTAQQSTSRVKACCGPTAIRLTITYPTLLTKSLQYTRSSLVVGSKCINEEPKVLGNMLHSHS
jgi:hypothetical protein